MKRAEPPGEDSHEALSVSRPGRIRPVAAGKTPGQEPANVSIRRVLDHRGNGQVVPGPPHSVGLSVETREPVGLRHLQEADLSGVIRQSVSQNLRYSLVRDFPTSVCVLCLKLGWDLGTANRSTHRPAFPLALTQLPHDTREGTLTSKDPSSLRSPPPIPSPPTCGYSTRTRSGAWRDQMREGAARARIRTRRIQKSKARFSRRLAAFLH